MLGVRLVRRLRRRGCNLAHGVECNMLPSVYAWIWVLGKGISALVDTWHSAYRIKWLDFILVFKGNLTTRVVIYVCGLLSRGIGSVV